MNESITEWMKKTNLHIDPKAHDEKLQQSYWAMDDSFIRTFWTVYHN